MSDFTLSSYLLRTLGAGTVKGLLVSGILGVCGLVWHNVSETTAHTNQLTQQQTQLDKLSASSDATQQKLQDVGITIARVEGKLDTLGTKIDDDRRAQRRGN